MSISPTGSAPITPVTNKVVAPVVTKVSPTSTVQLAAAETKPSQQSQGTSPSGAGGNTQPLNTRGRGQIVNLLV